MSIETIKLRIVLTLVFACLLFSTFAQSSTNIDLSEAEKEHLSVKGKVTMCVDPDWMPYEKIDENGKHVGIAADFMSEFQKGIPVPIELVQTESWQESLEAAKSRQCDILSLLNESPQRHEFLNFTKAYLTDSVVIVAKNDVFYLDGLKSLSGRKLGIVDGYVYEEKILEQYPEIEIVSVKSTRDALLKVSDGEIYATLDALFIITRHIQELGLSNLKIAGHTGLDNVFKIGVRKDDPILLSVFDKAIKNLDDATRNTILRSWYTIKFQYGTDWRMVWQVTCIAIIILCLLGYNTLLVRRFNRKLAEANELLLNKNQELAGSEKQFRALANASYEGILIHENGIILESNQLAAKLLGFELKELIGINAMGLVTPEFHQELHKNINSLNEAYYELNCQRKDGTLFPTIVNTKPMSYNNRSCRVVAFRDITQEKKAREERLQLIKELQETKYVAERESVKVKAMSQDKLASLGLLATGVAHEINQPLTYIKIIFESTLRDITANVLDQKELVNDCTESLKQIYRITTIINHLREFGREDVFDLREVYINEVLGNTLILMQQRLKLRNIKFIQDVPSTLPPVYGNSIKLEQIFINLIQNSVDSLEGQVDAEILVSAYQENDTVKVKFCDNGENIPEDILDKIYDPFFTTKEVGKGTGLGLSIVYSIIEDHHGNIEYLSGEIGACFLITLPVIINNDY